MHALRLAIIALLSLLTAMCQPAYAQQLRLDREFSVPYQALEHLPTLRRAQLSIWPDAPMPAFLAAQVEQESCISLKHRRCWNPRVELKTHAEYGFGLGQTTIAYDKFGNVRFNKWAELRTRYPQSLSGWTWENRYDPFYQLTALVEMDKASYELWPDAATVRDRLGFMLSGYNGGDGHVKKDRVLCRHTPGCDHTRWFGHVARHSVKTRIPTPGYKYSPYAINREYPENIMGFRLPKYIPFFRDEGNAGN